MQNKSPKRHSKPSWTIPLIFSLAFLFFFIIGIWAFGSTKDFSTKPLIFLSFAAILFIVCLFATARMCIGETKENNLASGKEQGFKTTANFLRKILKVETRTRVGSKYSPEHISKYYQIKYTYLDENGISRTRTSYTIFSTREVYYLKDLGTFNIVAKGKNAAIIEDLSDETIDNFYHSHTPHTETQQTEPSITPQETSKPLPLPAKNNTLIIAAGLSLLLCIAVIGVGIYWLCNKEIIGGSFAIMFTCFPLYCVYKFILPQINCDKKGMSDVALLTHISTSKRQQATHYYAIINYHGNEHKIHIFAPEWAVILQDYIDKEIPIKTLKDFISIDYRTLYSNGNTNQI